MRNHDSNRNVRNLLSRRELFRNLPGMLRAALDAAAQALENEPLSEALLRDAPHARYTLDEATGDIIDISYTE